MSGTNNHAIESLNVIKKGFNEFKLPYNESTERMSLHAVAAFNKNEVVLVAGVDEETQTIEMVGAIDVTFDADVESEVSIAMARMNHRMKLGFFDYNAKEGNFYFRLSNSYRDGSLNTEVVKYMIATVYGTLNAYCHILESFANKAITLDEFLRRFNSQELLEDKERRNYIFTITKGELEEMLMARYKANASKYHVAGYRMGLAPLSALKKVYGEDVFFKEVINDYVVEKLGALGCDKLENARYSVLKRDEHGCVSVNINFT